MLEAYSHPLTRGVIQFKSEEECLDWIGLMEKENTLSCLIEDEEWVLRKLDETQVVDSCRNSSAEASSRASTG
jgi:hypothetical protein